MPPAIENVLLIVNEAKKKAALLAGEVALYFTGRGIPVDRISSETEPERLKKYSLAMAFGGDGTALAAARILAGLNIPIMAVNLGALGFLADFLPHEWQAAVESFEQGRLMAPKRAMLHVSVKREGKNIYEGAALNEAVIAGASSSNLVALDLSVSSENLGLVRADGIIVASPTGSTAYALAAGGPIAPPDAEMMLVVPVSPFSLSMRPLALPAWESVAVSVVSGQRIKTLLTLDGQKAIELQEGDQAVMRFASQKALLLHTKERGFYQVLKYKLGWKGLPDGQEE